MFRRRGRKFTASVYMGELPDILADEEGEPLNPPDRHIWQRLISQAEVIEGTPDTEYKKDGIPLLVRIPGNCDYWVDGQRLIIAHDKLICLKCHCFLDDGACSQCGGSQFH